MYARAAEILKQEGNRLSEVLRNLDDLEKAAFIAAILTNNHKAVLDVLYEPILQTLKLELDATKKSELRTAVYALNTTKPEDKKEVEKQVKKIGDILGDPSNAQLVFKIQPITVNAKLGDDLFSIVDKILVYPKDQESMKPPEKNSILEKAMQYIPDDEISIQVKKRFLQKAGYAGKEYFIAYDEPLTALKTAPPDRNISIKEYKQLVTSNTLDESEFIILTIDVLEAIAKKDEAEVKEGYTVDLGEIQRYYLDADYTQAINAIRNFVQTHLKTHDIEKILLDESDNLKIIPSVIDPKKNYVRKIFETRIGQYYKGILFEDKEIMNAIQKVTNTLLNREVKIDSQEKAEFYLLKIADFSDIESDDLTKFFKDGSMLYAIKDRGQRKNVYSTLEELDLPPGPAYELKQSSLSKNLGLLSSHQPDVYTSKRTLRNRNPDVLVSKNTEIGYSSVTRSKAVFTASLSGHAYHIAADLYLYARRRIDAAKHLKKDFDKIALAKELQADINSIIKTNLIIYISQGYHSFHEFLDPFKEPHVIEAFKNIDDSGIAIQFDLSIPNKVIENTFKDTESYARNLCLKRLTLKDVTDKGVEKLKTEFKREVKIIVESKKADSEKSDDLRKCIESAVDAGVLDPIKDVVNDEKTIALLSEKDVENLLYYPFERIYSQYEKIVKHATLDDKEKILKLNETRLISMLLENDAFYDKLSASTISNIIKWLLDFKDSEFGNIMLDVLFKARPELFTIPEVNAFIVSEILSILSGDFIDARGGRLISDLSKKIKDIPDKYQLGKMESDLFQQIHNYSDPYLYSAQAFSEDGILMNLFRLVVASKDKGPMFYMALEEAVRGRLTLLLNKIIYDKDILPKIGARLSQHTMNELAFYFLNEVVLQLKDERLSQTEKESVIKNALEVLKLNPELAKAACGDHAIPTEMNQKDGEKYFISLYLSHDMMFTKFPYIVENSRFDIIQKNALESFTAEECIKTALYYLVIACTTSDFSIKQLLNQISKIKPFMEAKLGSPEIFTLESKDLNAAKLYDYFLNISPSSKIETHLLKEMICRGKIAVNSIDVLKLYLKRDISSKEKTDVLNTFIENIMLAKNVAVFKKFISDDEISNHLSPLLVIRLLGEWKITRNVINAKGDSVERVTSFNIQKNTEENAEVNAEFLKAMLQSKLFSIPIFMQRMRDEPSLDAKEKNLERIDAISYFLGVMKTLWLERTINLSFAEGQEISIEEFSKYTDAAIEWQYYAIVKFALACGAELSLIEELLPEATEYYKSCKNELLTEVAPSISIFSKPAEPSSATDVATPKKAPGKTGE